MAPLLAPHRTPCAGNTCWQGLHAPDEVRQGAVQGLKALVPLQGCTAHYVVGKGSPGDGTGDQAGRQVAGLAQEPIKLPLVISKQLLFLPITRRCATATAVHHAFPLPAITASTHFRPSHHSPGLT
jgi:hypothetical protein